MKRQNLGLALLLATLATAGPAEGQTVTSKVRGPLQPPAAGQDLLAGTIVMWSGTLASIPGGWLVCDGTQGTPDLRDRFVVGVLPGQEPGETGGAHSVQHTLENLPAHSHTLAVGLSDWHTHSYSDKSCLTAEFWHWGTAAGEFRDYGDDWHYPNTEASGVHTHTGTTSEYGITYPHNNRPSYLRVAFLMKSGSPPGGGLPLGSIVLWTDPLSALPTDWKVCNGSFGTPDFNDRFALSVRQGEEPGEMSGYNWSYINPPKHSHTFTTDPGGEHVHNLRDYYRREFDAYYGGLVQTHVVNGMADHDAETEDGGVHTHTGACGSTGSGTLFDNRPAHANLAYIIRTGTATGARVPGRVILAWTGTVASIPPGWKPCDGVGSSPDLRDRFVKGPPVGVDPGGFGGAHEVALTVANMTPHAHTPQFNAGGVHRHDFGDRYGTSSYPGFAGPFNTFYAYTTTTGTTRETYSDGRHGHSGVTDVAGSSLPYDNRPAYYRVIFIVKS